MIMMRQRRESFVTRLDFVTSAGFMEGGDARQRSGSRGSGPSRVITDLGVLEPDPVTRELTLVAVHPGVSAQQARDATGWELRVSPALAETEPVTDKELATLRDLKERSARAHGT